jgi:hypothetical protein
MLKKFHVKELCKKIFQENKAITLMTVENWEVGCKAIYIRILDYILKYNACMKNMQMNVNHSDF